MASLSNRTPYPVVLAHFARFRSKIIQLWAAKPFIYKRSRRYVMKMRRKCTDLFDADLVLTTIVFLLSNILVRFFVTIYKYVAES